MFLLLASLASAEDAPPIVNGSKTSGFKPVGALVSIQGNYGGSFCSGTLVAPSYVITAAHCVEAADEYKDYGYDIYFVESSDVYDEWDKYAKVKKTYGHSGYYQGSGINDDIGVLELYGSISGETMPVNTTKPKQSWGSYDVTYVGFGITDDGKNDGGVKRTVDVPYYGYDNSYIYTYSGDSGTIYNICSGDSGGAALIDFTGNGDYALVGANSFGFSVYGDHADCNRRGAAAGSTRIDAYYDWITDIIPESELGTAETDADTDADSDSDSDSDTDSDTDTDPVDDDTGVPIGADTGNDPLRPKGQDVGAGGLCSASPAASGMMGGLAVLGALLLRRRRR